MTRPFGGFGLNAIRWDLDGDGSPASANASDYSSAFPNAATGMGCPSSGCTGYELTDNLDLDVFPYNYGTGWAPIGGFRAPFTATFEGNGNTISALVIKWQESYMGLFGYVGNAGVIRNVKLTGVSVGGRRAVGGLAVKTTEQSVGVPQRLKYHAMSRNPLFQGRTLLAD